MAIIAECFYREINDFSTNILQTVKQQTKSSEFDIYLENRNNRQILLYFTTIITIFLMQVFYRYQINNATNGYIQKLECVCKHDFCKAV